jgi:hypothetical protein
VDPLLEAQVNVTVALPALAVRLAGVAGIAGVDGVAAPGETESVVGVLLVPPHALRDNRNPASISLQAEDIREGCCDIQFCS